MDAERFSRLEALFFEAQDIPASARDRWIAEQCHDDMALADELRQMLEASDKEDDPARRAIADAEVPQGLIGREIGPYTLLAELGQGGMGTVFEAARTGEDFDQRVALKLLRLGLRDPTSIERFRRERQVLARLSHPGIATLIDGGTADDGTPWVAMEQVAGAALDHHAEAEGLDLAERVALLIKVCDAMAYAHRNLIVHRDLKPDNVLVDATGTPRVLDFGIAKLLDDEAQGTATLHRAFTPRYAAPEQILGEPATTAGDVYSLGVMLYELVTGSAPIEFDPARRTDWARLAAQVEPIRPRARRADLPKDLEAVLLMALRKDPARRYANAADLGDDLRRYLANRPVIARPDSASYRLRKAIDRHPWPFATGGVVLVLLTLFVASTVRQNERIADERDTAVREARISASTTDFLVDLFQAPDPKELGGRELTAADLLDRGRARIDELEAEPLVEARLRHVMGLAYGNLGRFDPGIELLEEGLALRLEIAGEESPEVADSRNRLGNILRAAGRYREAEPLLVAALAYRASSGEAASVDLADSHNNVGLLQRDLAKYEDAAANLERAVALHLEVTGPSTSVAVASHNLALVRIGQDRALDAVPLLEYALELKEELGLGERATYANSEAALARALLNAGQLDRALEFAERALALRERVLPADHPRIGASHGTLADVLVAHGRITNARSSYEEGVRIAEIAYGSDGWRAVRARAERARLLELVGEWSAAERAYRKALQRARDEFEADSLHIATARVDLGRLLLLAGDAAAARTLLADALATRRALGPEHSAVLEAEALLAWANGENVALRAGTAEDPRIGARLLRQTGTLLAESES